MKLLIDANGLTGYVGGSLSTPPSSVTDNLLYVTFVQQEKLLASWLLSTISGELLTSFPGASTTREIWSRASRLFATASNVKVTHLKHNLYLLKKGDLLVLELFDQVRSMCDLSMAYENPVFEREQVQVVLARHPIKFELMVTTATPSPVPL